VDHDHPLTVTRCTPLTWTVAPQQATSAPVVTIPEWLTEHDASLPRNDAAPFSFRIGRRSYLALVG
jgi:hypothetical protein